MSEIGIASIQIDDTKTLARCIIQCVDSIITITFPDIENHKLFQQNKHIVSYVNFCDERNKVQCYLKEPIKRTDEKIGPILVDLYLNKTQFKTIKSWVDNRSQKYTISSKTDFAPTDRCSLCINDVNPPIEDGHGIGKCVPPELIDNKKIEDETTDKNIETTDKKIDMVEENTDKVKGGRRWWWFW